MRRNATLAGGHRVEESISRLSVIGTIAELIESCLAAKVVLAQRGDPPEGFQMLDAQILILMKLAGDLELYEEVSRTVAIPEDLRDQYEGLPPR